MVCKNIGLDQISVTNQNCGTVLNEKMGRIPRKRELDLELCEFSFKCYSQITG